LLDFSESDDMVDMDMGEDDRLDRDGQSLYLPQYPLGIPTRVYYHAQSRFRISDDGAIAVHGTHHKTAENEIISGFRCVQT
tara:strand:- start:924 stop:1166 length:243 start_codon:yes stop_codon:yes gene_type:complete